ncbi:MAG TPA: YdbL family protein [Novosphingobium sp.]|nr:YdbL family protein [Novosphingobium sp.]
MSGIVFRTGICALAAGLAVAAVSPAFAQGRDPAYAAARSAGQVGEMPNGYLGMVGAQSPEVKRLVEDINIRRKAVYAEKAQAQHVTVEDYAFATGCRLIAQTEPGEKYQDPQGRWQGRAAAAPVRDSRCPAN